MTPYVVVGHDRAHVRQTEEAPIDNKSVAARLEHAQNDQLLVHVRRWIPDSDRLEGFVVLNEDYATRIAGGWNVKHFGVGYVT